MGVENNSLGKKLADLQREFAGEIRVDDAVRLMYATDASAYREKPLAVAFPGNKDDIKKLILFASETKIPIIPRAAGTSLAGQVVGNGIVADISKHMTRILEINEKEHWVRVEPGVVLDELNNVLKPKGLFFGPETSTANRCNIGGMVGNNSCGAHSLIYGSTRDHTLEVKALLSDASEVFFGPLKENELTQKWEADTLEGKIYRHIKKILDKPENQKEILEQFPDLSLERRNTGYALDMLFQTDPWQHNGVDFNMSRLLAGSEGTLAFTTEVKLNLVPLPPEDKGLVCIHHKTIREALEANLVALKMKPFSVELIEKTLLDLTRENIEQNKNRFFVKGDPGAILVVEFAEESMEAVKEKARQLESAMRAKSFGYHFPLITGSDMSKIWSLRKAGLGILNNMPGDSKPVSLTEDTAVNPKVLPQYIEDFKTMLKKHGKESVYYGHISTGELHLRPVMDLKKPEEVNLFHKIGLESAVLVKKYNGSLSGEHGDGRLRGEFIPLMVGKTVYSLFREIKKTWDPDNILNPGKITDTPRMNSNLRYLSPTPEIKTFLDFSKDQGIVRAAEKCNGTGECRKSALAVGTMCPSFMATHDEDKTTRARANILREFLTLPNQKNPFDHKEIYDVLDMCLMCKACKSECPSSVDITKLKAEFLQHHYDTHGVPVRTRMIANISRINRIGSIWPSLYNFIQKNRITKKISAKIFGFSDQRRFPLLTKRTLERWFRHHQRKQTGQFTNGKVYLFNDEFTRFNDTQIGIKAILLLNRLGYEVVIPNHLESARTYLSKGLVKKAKEIANANIRMLKDKISESIPLVGIEPSAILTFRDEYLDLADKDLLESARELSKSSMMIDEFLEREMKAGKINKEQFTSEAREIKLHGHCHQKSLASTTPTMFVLNFPENYHATEIPSGCCGMAGSFGFEKEHYELSMKVGELVLFPAVRNSSADTIITAPGTSCRHQIKDGTQRDALHPVEVIYEALIK